MSVIGEVLEFVLELALDVARNRRMAAALAATGLLVWLILAYGPQNTAGTGIAIGVGIAGVVIGWRRARAAEER